MTQRVEHLNPKELPQSPAFSQVVAVTGPAKTVYVGGQNAVTAAGELVGEGDVAVQAEQVFRNLEAALGAAGARLEHVVKWTIHVVAGQAVGPAFGVFERVWPRGANPPVITVAFVSGLAVPGALVELDAVAVVPD